MAAHSEYLAGLTLEDRTALEGRLLDRQSGKCFICDDTIDPVLHQDQLDVDHIVPLAEQGSDDEHNFALTHASCNRSKGASDLRVARRMAEFEKLQQQALERGERGANLGHVLAEHGGAKAAIRLQNSGGRIEFTLSATWMTTILSARRTS